MDKTKIKIINTSKREIERNPDKYNIQNIDYINIHYDELIKSIIFCNRFLYLSYDHKKALEEYRTNDNYKLMRKHFRNPNSWDMPTELKENYKVYRVGKLRHIYFGPSGKAVKFHIGAKRAKTFYINDFGNTVFLMNNNKK